MEEPTNAPGGEWLEVTDPDGKLHRVPSHIAATLYNSGYKQGVSQITSKMEKWVADIRAEVAEQMAEAGAEPEQGGEHGSNP